VSGWPEWLGLAAAISLAGQAAATLFMVWTHLWYPVVLAAFVAIISAVLLATDIWNNRKEVRVVAGSSRI
jgi:L-alanine-DL-glutamate epimerase-like enolase superfamily enzyme